MDSTETNDILYGALKMRQPKEGEGPRVNVDTILLAHFARVSPSSRVIEMGCAHGAIALIIAKRRRLASPSRQLPAVDAFDIDCDLVALARENAALNGLSDDVRFFGADLRDVRKHFRAETYDAVIMNPPYGEPRSHRVSERDAIARSMNGSECSLADVVSAAKFLLKNGGKCFLVMRAVRTAELMSLLAGANVRAKRMRAIHPKPDRDAASVLIEAVRDSGEGLKIEPPLYIEGHDGKYTRELLAAYEL